jgi:hypothetical protein
MKPRSWRVRFPLPQHPWSAAFIGQVALYGLSMLSWLNLTAGAQTDDGPLILRQPASQFVLAGGPAVFSVAATNPAWTRVPISAGDWNASTNIIITDQTSGTLQVDYSFYSLPDTLHVYYDDVLVFDSGATSGSGTFWIAYGPGWDTRLVLVMDEGGNPLQDTLWDYSAAFSVNLTYQWRKDGADLPAATNSTFSISPAQLSDAGVYSVVVSNQFGGVVSASALLSFSPPPRLRIVLSSTSTAVLAWPAPSPGYVLESTDAVDPTNWAVVPDVPAVVGKENQVVVPLGNAAQFYRLGIR